VRTAAVAEAQVAAARIEQPVVGRAGSRRRIELDRAERMTRELHHVPVAQELAPRPRERARLRIRRVPLRENVVVRDVARPEARRNEVELRGIPGGALEMRAVPQAVAREVGMERETDEAALEPAVERARECGPDVRVQRGARAVGYIKEAARIVREAAAVRRIAHEADARPPRGRDVLVD